MSSNTEPSTGDQMFSPGEIAIVLPDPRGWWPEYDNTECTIESGPTMHECCDRYGDHPVYGYAVRAFDGDELIVEPWLLKKKRPPREDMNLVRWSECPWQPEQVRA